MKLHRLIEPSRADVLKLIHDLRPVYSGHELVRLGASGDGGYLVPDDLEGLSACFSPGVGYLSAFERDLYDQGIQIFMADNSVDDPSDDHYRFHFTKKHIGPDTSDGMMTMSDWVVGSGHTGSSDLLLQMDIEGAEYEIINGMKDDLIRQFRIIIIECHFLRNLWNKRRFPVLRGFFDKLLKSHQCIHIHPNNTGGRTINHGIEIPNVLEFTFLRRDRILKKKNVTSLPHPLDEPNGDRPELVLSDAWYYKNHSI